MTAGAATTRPSSVLLASDVDGTFWSEGLTVESLCAAWERRPSQVEVLFASSRTVEELAHLDELLGAGGDFIAENGAVVVTRDDDVAWHLPGARRERIGHGHVFIAVLGEGCGEARRVVRSARARHGAPVQLMEELEPATLRRLIGDDGEVQRAASRRASVLVHADVGDDAVVAWGATLRRAGYQVLSGGRWLAVWRGPGKGQALRRYLRARTLAGRSPAVVAAIGDGENDISLLQAAELRFAVPRPDGTVHPALSALADVSIAPEVGTAGWCRVVSTLGGLPCHS